MADQRALLLIADISGYTRFMRANRATLAHAQEIVARLLEAVLDTARGFRLAKLEGDAAFFYALGARGSHQTLGRRVAAMRSAFLRKKQALLMDRMCHCEACVQLEDLGLKFVAHEGDVAFQRVGSHRELAGVDVILVHRMLKNRVPMREYVLLTDAARPWLDAELQGRLEPLVEDFEGLGETQTHYLALEQLPMETAPVPGRSLLRKIWVNLRLSVATLVYLLRLRQPLLR